MDNEKLKEAIEIMMWQNLQKENRILRRVVCALLGIIVFLVARMLM
jgi:hypothetical protein